MTIETELKLRMPPRMNAVLRRWMATHFPDTPPKTEQLTSIYYDTPDLALAAHGIGLRLRKVDGQWIQTVKLGEKTGAGLHQRPELEAAVDGPTLERNRITDQHVQQLLTDDAVAPALAPLLNMDIKRTSWTLQDNQNNTLEICLDHGLIHTQDQTLKLNEVEIELKQGDVNGVFDMALRLAQSFPLIPDPQSKAERGYALFRKESLSSPSKARIPTLRAELLSNLVYSRLSS